MMNKSKEAVRMFDKRAKEYAKRYSDVSLYSDILNTFCKEINDENASILELGCGPGNITRYLLDYSSKYKILATDLAPRMIEQAQVNCPAAIFKRMDCRNLLELAETFDAIMASFCLPYIEKSAVLELLDSAYKLLNIEGVLYLSTMEGAYLESRFQVSSSGDKVFVHYYEKSFLEKALIKVGFETIETRVQVDPTQKEKTKDLIILAKKV